MKRLHDQGLAVKYIHSVFQAIIVSHILYALPAWGCFLSKELSGRIDVIVMGLRRKLNMLTSYSTVLVWTCFTKYVALNTVCMIFCLL